MRGLRNRLSSGSAGTVGEQVAACLVSGAASGIGAAIARRLHDDGYDVYAGDIAWTAASDGPRWHERALDVTSPDSWRALTEEITATGGGIEVLVNNAGLVGSYAGLHEIDLADWNRIIDVNLNGTVHGLRSVLPSMMAARRGSVVNVSSIWGVLGAKGVAAYQASKGAVSVVTRNAATTYAEYGIRVNSVHPGLIWTPMTRAQDPAISDGLITVTPLGRAGEPEEVAAAVSFLAGPDASYITGQQLFVDGGFSSV